MNELSDDNGFGYVKGKPLPRFEDAAECIRCGACCLASLCPYGEFDAIKNCKHLIILPDKTTKCARYDEIINGNDQTWVLAPAFGAGCCRRLNRKVLEIEPV